MFWLAQFEWSLRLYPCRTYSCDFLNMWWRVVELGWTQLLPCQCGGELAWPVFAPEGSNILEIHWSCWVIVSPWLDDSEQNHTLWGPWKPCNVIGSCLNISIKDMWTLAHNLLKLLAQGSSMWAWNLLVALTFLFLSVEGRWENKTLPFILL